MLSRLLPVSLIALTWSATPGHAASPAEATRLVEKSERQTRGDSFQATVEMKVSKPGSDRQLGFKIWTQGRDKAMVKIHSPARDKGTANLRLQLNLWQYLPNVDRVVKVPPSMMMQSWMGSDFTNDDLVKSSSLARDYTHLPMGMSKVPGQLAIQIQCLPKPTAAVVWGKVMLWVTPGDAVPIRQEFYSESGKLLKTMEGSDIRQFGTHKVPTTVKMTSADKPGNSTVIRYSSIVFDTAIPGSTFSQEYLRKP